MHRTSSTATKPSHYDILIRPNIVGGSFEGIVTIHVDFVQPTSCIELHSKNLNILETSVQDEGGNDVLIASAYKDDTLQKTTFMLYNSIPEGSKLQIYLKYSASMTTIGAAFHQTEVSWLKYAASTFMESIGARKVFPCFDDPAQKATFSVSLQVDKHLTCIGNMPIRNEISLPSADKKIIVFERTPPMSTYLVAFAIGVFDFIEESLCSVPLRAYVPKGYKANCEYALKVAADALRFFKDKFDINALCQNWTSC